MVKKIAFILPDFRGGGAEGVMISLANFFARECDVLFVVGRDQGIRKDSLVPLIKVIELGETRARYLPFKLVEVLKRHEVDVALATLSHIYLVAVAKILIGKRCRCIARIGNIVSEDAQNRGAIKSLLSLMGLQMVSLCDVVLAQSKYMERDIAPYIPARRRKALKTIYNPVDIEFIKAMSVEECRDFDKKNTFNIVSIGRLVKQKDYITALKAFSLLKQRLPQAVYWILGDGVLKNKLQEFSQSLGLEIDKDVIFLGYESNPFKYLAKCQCLLLTSLYEGFANVILQALALEVPVVASNSPGGNAEIIVNGKNGYLCQVGNEKEFSECLLYVKQRQDVFCFDVDKFSLDNIAREYAGVFGI